MESGYWQCLAFLPIDKKLGLLSSCYLEHWGGYLGIRNSCNFCPLYVCWLGYFILQWWGRIVILINQNDMKVHVLNTHSKSAVCTYFYGDFAFSIMLSLALLVYYQQVMRAGPPRSIPYLITTWMWGITVVLIYYYWVDNQDILEFDLGYKTTTTLTNIWGKSIILCISVWNAKLVKKNCLLRKCYTLVLKKKNFQSTSY